MSWLSDYTHGDLDYRAPPGPTAQAARRAFRRFWTEIVLVACWLFVIALCGVAFVLFTLPALPLILPDSAKVAARPPSIYNVDVPKSKGDK